LQDVRKKADLVEKEHAPVRRLEEPELGAVRIGEGASFEAEQFGLEQRFRDGGTVDVNKRPLCPDAVAMQHARGEAFAGAGVALNEDRWEPLTLALSLDEPRLMFTMRAP